MTPRELDSASYSLTVGWYGRTKPAKTEFRLDEATQLVAMVVEQGFIIDSITSDCPDVGFLFEQLAPLGIPENDEIKVNGILTTYAKHADGTAALVPWGSNEPGVGLLVSGAAHWDSAGPCTFDQYEDLLCIGDLYWVHTSGDLEARRLVVGRFSDPDEGLRACVEASCFCHFSKDGTAYCELDDWPSNDEYEQEEDDAIEDNPDDEHRENLS